jgi:prepilin-type N-terminal cleavage/methylation domain-containing protein
VRIRNPAASKASDSHCLCRIRNTHYALRSAFTLVELLLALTLVAIISGGMALSFNTALHAAGSIQQRTQVTDEQRKLVAQLRTDLEGVWVRPGSLTAASATTTTGATTWFRAGNLSTDPNLTAGTTAGEAILAVGDSLELTTTRPISLDALQMGSQGEGTFGPQSDVASVSWRLEQGPNGSLVLVRRQRTPPDPTVDETQDPSVVRTVMSSSAASMQVLVYDGTQWLEAWDAALPMSENDPSLTSGTTGGTTSGTTGGTTGGGTNTPAGLPQAVQVTLMLAPGATNSVSARPPSAQNVPLSLIVAMPAAESQVLQEETQSTAGGVGG